MRSAMRTGYSIKRFQYISITALIAGFFLSGCGSSRPVIEEDRIQDQIEQIEQLQHDNAELRRELAQQAQENRSLNARVAELEKQLLEERERLKALEEAREPSPRPDLADISVREFDREYNRALNMFMNRRYEDAKNLFSALLHSGVEHPLILNCQYWIGESLFGMREYRRAIEEFQKVFNYTSQLKYDDAQIMIANSYFMLGNKERAREEYQTLLDRYPNSDYVAFARLRLREI